MISLVNTCLRHRVEDAEEAGGGIIREDRRSNW